MYEALLAALALAAYAPSADAGAARAPANAAPSALTIHVRNFKFEPAVVTIRAGERVRFVNDDDEAHTVTASDKSFDSQGLDGGRTWQHVFPKPGTYTYYCELHPYMKAEIVVVAAGEARRRRNSTALDPFANRPVESGTLLGAGQNPMRSGTWL